MYNTLDVTFAGGTDRSRVKDVEVICTGSDGKTVTKKLKPAKGEVVTFQGTKGTDKVVPYVDYYFGNRYNVVDQPIDTPNREPGFTKP
ncbi:MAG: hypothetical protein NTV68_13415 [Methanomicrobiales archaeon]|nr:hypothetical protein [Methanomicrobiales archaeon]